MTEPPRGSWASLAREIQLLILQEVINSQDVGCPIARHASVCKDWQGVFEPALFGDLSIRPEDIEATRKMTQDPRRRQMVRRISLRIDICFDPCRACEAATAEPVDRVERALLDFLVILSTWALEPNGKGVEVDIGTSVEVCHSPARNSKRPATKPRIEPSRFREQMRMRNTQPPGYNRPEVDRHQFTRPKYQIELPSTRPFWTELPARIPVVTGLTLRRQTRTHYAPEIIAELVRRFPRLKKWNYEPWRRKFEPRKYDEIWARQFDQIAMAGKWLDTVVLFEDNMINHWIWLYGAHPVEPCRVPYGQLSASIAKASIRLVELSASFMADAGQFFDAWQEGWVWERLRKLALTTWVFTLQGAGALVGANEMLQKAARVVAHMPQLETLELWNGGRYMPDPGFAGLFRYQYQKPSVSSPQRATVTWRGSWDLTFEPETIRAWKAVAEQRFGDHQGIFEVLNERLAEPIDSHAQAVVELGLVSEVACPLSLWQIHEEDLASELRYYA